jgi:hypothetical protein
MADTAPQSAASHARWSPPFHFVAVPLLMANVVVVVIAAVKAPGLSTAFAAAVAFAILVIAFLTRLYALGVQDRLIRLEEQIRMARLLPAEMQGQVEALTVEQMVGLRFASDDELPGLVKAVLDEGIADRKAIKARVKHWRPDHQRI